MYLTVAFEVKGLFFFFLLFCFLYILSTGTLKFYNGLFFSFDDSYRDQSTSIQLELDDCAHHVEGFVITIRIDTCALHR